MSQGSRVAGRGGAEVEDLVSGILEARRQADWCRDRAVGHDVRVCSAMDALARGWPGGGGLAAMRELDSVHESVMRTFGRLAGDCDERADRLRDAVRERRGREEAADRPGSGTGAVRDVKDGEV